MPKPGCLHQVANCPSCGDTPTHIRFKCRYRAPFRCTHPAVLVSSGRNTPCVFDFGDDRVAGCNLYELPTSAPQLRTPANPTTTAGEEAAAARAAMGVTAEDFDRAVIEVAAYLDGHRVAKEQLIDLTPGHRERMRQTIYGPAEPGVCRVCACTDDHACEGGCAWADEDRTLCSACAPPVLQRCDRCGGESYDFKQWMGGLRTCMPCTLTLQAIEACMLVCEHCLDGKGLLPLKGPRVFPTGRLAGRYHPEPDFCTAFRLREKYELGDGPLNDWITDQLSEPVPPAEEEPAR